MKKASILLAAMICMLLSVNASAQPCEPLTVDVQVWYNSTFYPVPDSLCIRVIWDFGDGKICNQNDTWVRGSNDPLSGSFIVTSTLDVESCLGECLTEDDVVSITVIVNDCGNGGLQRIETVYKYTTPIPIRYY
jgi:hypothetical protein